ncbi:S8 family serine peptidase [candidate division WOR-3 bacterium]|uniref:S8 family serine peptidase n=1 Tax=candidate division WOR-3 bacterium TaxID=2052148 RepID=A0A9D5QDT5_UNCW3|nr:S8 family serine peptidase [candidate division WOR-3 bacterium]MBD3365381.1 S8 family serine peptidase [candidate division WOR-3 bacterium]
MAKEHKKGLNALSTAIQGGFMKQAFALLFLPFVITGGMITGTVSATQTRAYEDASVIHLPCGKDIDSRTDIDLRDQALMENEELSGSYLVKFSGPVYPEHRQALERIGAEIYDYLPNYTYLVRMKPAGLFQALDSDEIEWIGCYEPSYKISPGINTEDTYTRELVVILFPGNEVSSLTGIVNGLGGEIIEGSACEWATFIRVNLPSSRIPDLAEHEEVKWIEEYHQAYFMNEDAQWVIQSWDEANKTRKIWNQGIKGEGQVINVMDSGVRTSHDYYRDNSVSITDWGDYPSHRKIIAYEKTFAFPPPDFGDDVIVGHGTHTSGSALGYDDPVGGSSPNDGMAPEAKLYFIDGGREDYPYHVVTGSNLQNVLNLAYEGNSAGAARISSHSWGTQTSRAYDTKCMQMDRTMWDAPDFLILSSAGNLNGGDYTGSPGNAKNLVCVGACRDGESANKFASSVSSSGPAGDGRIRPDIVTPGEGITSASSASNTGERTTSGTSMACPIAAGGAALIRQYLTEGYTGSPHTPSAALLKAMLINAVETDNTNFWGKWIPAPEVGWGRPNLDNVLVFDGDAENLAYVDEKSGLSTGQEYNLEIPDATDSIPFKVTLNWTDYPGANMSHPSLVNDLDLEVTSPTGKVYLGNNFSGSDNGSVEGGEVDSLNPTENVFVLTPEEGTWHIKVKANNVPQGPQPFALVVTYDSLNTGSLPLQLEIPVIQNPLLPQYADIWVVPINKPLSATPGVSLNISGTDEDLTVEQVAGSYAFVGDYKFSQTGTATVSVITEDTTIQRNFSVNKVSATGGSFTSPDRRCMLEIPGQAIDEAAFITLAAAQGYSSGSPSRIMSLKEGIGPAYRIGPAGLELALPATVSMSYSLNELGSAEPSDLVIMRLEDGLWEPVSSFIDTKHSRVVGVTSKLGVYRLAVKLGNNTPEVSRKVAVEPCATTPSPGERVLRLSLASKTQVSVSLFDASGRKVKTIIDRKLPLGEHEFTWEGKDGLGRTLAPGVYFLQVKTPLVSKNLKIISLH